MVFIEKYYKSLADDIGGIERALAQEMPTVIRAGLESELRRLKAMRSILLGGDKEPLHSLRGKLRWARVWLRRETNPARRQALAGEVKTLEDEIARQVKT